MAEGGGLYTFRFDPLTEDGSRVAYGEEVAHPAVHLTFDAVKLRSGVQEFTIGRGRSSNLILGLPVISSKHATLTFFIAPADDAVHVVLIDTSANGVWVNGAIVGRGQACELRDEDVITLSRAVGSPHIKYRLTIVRPAEEGDAPAVAPLTKTLSGPVDPSVVASHYSIATLKPSGEEEAPKRPPPTSRITPLRRVGDVHDTYTFSESSRLGDGAYSVVFRGRHKTTGEAVAIKRVDIARTHQSAKAIHSGADPLEEEVKILGQLQHRHIVKLHEVIVDPGAKPKYMYIVQELVTGGELFNKVVTKGHFVEGQVRGLFKQLLNAVAYLHASGVVHRDLKPENILLQPYLSAQEGGKGVEKRYVVKSEPQVTDFGMARMSDRWGLDGSTIARMSTVVGTELYLAVEVRAKYEGYDAETLKRATMTALLHAKGEHDARLRKLARTAAGGVGIKRTRGEAGLEASGVDGPQPPPGHHYWPTDDDFDEIGRSIREGYTETVDSWSLGVILYICLAGTMPFWFEPGRGRPALLIQMMTMYLDFDADVWHTVSPEARDLLCHLLHPNPKKRWTVTKALLHPWLSGGSLSTVVAAVGAGPTAGPGTATSIITYPPKSPSPVKRASTGAASTPTSAAVTIPPSVLVGDHRHACTTPSGPTTMAPHHDEGNGDGCTGVMGEHGAADVGSAMVTTPHGGERHMASLWGMSASAPSLPADSDVHMAGTSQVHAIDLSLPPLGMHAAGAITTVSTNPAAGGAGSGSAKRRRKSAAVMAGMGGDDGGAETAEEVEIVATTHPGKAMRSSPSRVASQVARLAIQGTHSGGGEGGASRTRRSGGGGASSR